MHQSRFPVQSNGIFRQAILLAACLAAAAQATTYSITNNTMGLLPDGICGFREALDAVNSGIAKWGCAAPTNTNIINLSALTYTAQAALVSTRSVTINCPSGTCILDAGNLNADLFTIPSGNMPTVTLYRLNLRQSSGNPNSISGLVVKAGTVNLDQTAITGFHTVGLSIRSGTGHTLNRCTLSNNGYGLSLWDGVKLMSQSNSISNNWMGVQVGAVDLFYDIGSVISNNTDAGISVGISGDILLDKTTISGNRNRGIYMYESSNANMFSCAIENNTTPSDGAGIYIADNPNTNGFAFAQIFTSTISNNVAAGNGGGLYVAGSANLTNCTISKNTAASGGGSWSITKYTNSYLVYRYCTLAFNNATGSGGGITSVNGGGAQVVGVFNSIVAQNTSPQHPDISGPRKSGASLFGNLTGSPGYQDPTAPPDFPSADPILGDLVDNAGPNRVKTIALLPGSPAIDKAVSEGEFTDGRGFPRPAGVKWDLGAYEVMPFETERLAVVSSQGWHATQDDATLSNGSGTVLRSGAIGNYVTYVVAVPYTTSGTGGTKYKIEIGAKTTPDGAIVELATAPGTGVFTRIGEVDMYSSTAKAAVLPPQTSTPLTFNFTSSGIKHFRLKITGRNPANTSGYAAFFDYIRITKL